MDLSDANESIQTELSLGFKYNDKSASRVRYLDEVNFSLALPTHHSFDTYNQNIQENVSKSIANFGHRETLISSPKGGVFDTCVHPSLVVASSGDSDDLHNILSSDPLGNVPCGAGCSMLDEGSTNAVKRMKVNNDGIFGLLAAQKNGECLAVIQTEEEFEKEDDLNSCRLSSQSVVCDLSSIGGQTTSNILSKKMCRFSGCKKHARGASGHCITHGGGRRCQKPNCTKGAESRTNFCKTHGGGPRCQRLGCLKSAEGKTDFCIAHGGGCRCSFEGCTKAARGKSGKCIRHGGGKRCQKDGCAKSAEGISGLCISHGGGKRCQFLGCDKGAQGSTMFCKGHGGGKRCVFEGCTKGAEGSTLLCKAHGGGKRCTSVGCPKSVHGATLFCVAHGGGKRCSFAGCTKSARGRTDFCVRHGGGKRCKFQDCNKSAQGSTDFCKAHGGGKKYIWSSKSSLHQASDGNMFSDQISQSLCEAQGTSMQQLVARRSNEAMSVGTSCRSIGKKPDGKYYNAAIEGIHIHYESTAVSDACDPYQEMICPSHETLADKVQMNHISIDGALNNPSTILLTSLEQRVHGGSLLAHIAKDGRLQPSTLQLKNWRES